MSPEEERWKEIFSEEMADAYARRYEPLSQALNKERDLNRSLYDEVRPLLHRYEALLLALANNQAPEAKEEIMALQPKLSSAIHDRKRESESYRQTISEIKNELDRIEKLYFPSIEDIERN